MTDSVDEATAIAARLTERFPREFPQLRANLTRKMTDGELAQPDDVPDVVWHHTDAAGLLGILTTNQLWASNPLALNDATEFRYGLGMVSKIVLGLTEDRSDDEPSFDDMGDERTLLRYLPYAFAVSATSKRDSLVHWDRYSGKQGFAIGLRTATRLESVVTRPSATNPANSSGVSVLRGWNKVAYDAVDQMVLITALLATIGNRDLQGKITALESELQQRKNTQSGDSSAEPDAEFHERLGQELADRLGQAGPSSLASLCCVLKHPGFAEEAEIRYLASPTSLAEVAFRASPSGLTPFIPIAAVADERSEPPPPRLPITEILIGPPNTNHSASTLVTWALAAHGYEGVSVEHSSVPYRG